MPECAWVCVGVRLSVRTWVRPVEPVEPETYVTWAGASPATSRRSAERGEFGRLLLAE